MSPTKTAVVGSIAALLGVALARPFRGQMTPPSQALAPDVVFFNAKFVTVDQKFSVAEAVAVRNGKIMAVGPRSGVRALAGPHTQLVDLGGRTVLPGFNDNHIHMQVGRRADDDGVDWEQIDTFDGLARAIRERAAALPAGAWITGGLTRPYFPNDKAPDRWALDKVETSHPIALTRGHLMMVNSAGLRRAGIKRTTRDPDGGWIVRTADGEPTGHLYESGAKRLVTRVIPRSPPVDDETARRNFRQKLANLTSLGYTSLNVPGMRPDELHFVQDVYDRWGEDLPRMTVQIRVSPGYDVYDDVEEGATVAIQEIEGLGFHTGFGNDRLKLGAIKMSVDGGLSAPDFWTKEPYEGKPDFYGVVRIPEATLYRVGKRAHDLGWQLGIHTIGDAAAEMAVNVIERIQKESPRADARDYLHHVSVMPPGETLSKMANLGVIVATQPAFMYWLGPFAVEALEGDREQTNNPQQTLVNRGIRLSYGTDGAPTDPLVEIWSAVTRQGWDGKTYGPQERVSVRDAIRFITMGTAYMNFDERVKGSLEVGRLADMVVLDEDILAADPDHIKSIPVAMTIIGGKVVFSCTQPGRKRLPIRETPTLPTCPE